MFWIAHIKAYPHNQQSLLECTRAVLCCAVTWLRGGLSHTHGECLSDQRVNWINLDAGQVSEWNPATPTHSVCHKPRKRYGRELHSTTDSPQQQPVVPQLYVSAGAVLSGCSDPHRDLIPRYWPAAGQRMAAKRDFHFSIDRGGTFTDVFAQVSCPCMGN